MAGGFPAISGNDLIKVLTRNPQLECVQDGKRKHGVAIVRRTGGRFFTTVVPSKNDSLPNGTLGAILRQLGLTKEEIQQFL